MRLSPGIDDRPRRVGAHPRRPGGMERRQTQRTRPHRLFLHVLELLGALYEPLPREAGEDLSRAGREEDLGDVRDAAHELARVGLVEPVGDDRFAAAGSPHATARGVRHEQAGRSKVFVAREDLLRELPGARHRAGADRGDRRGHLDHDVVRRVPVVDVVGLERSAPAVDVLGHPGADAGRGVDAQVAPELAGAVPERVRLQHGRRMHGSGGDDHDLRPHGERGLRLPGVVEQRRDDTAGASVGDQDAVRAAASVDLRTVPLRSREVGEVRRLLRVGRTPECAHAAPAAPLDVPRDRRAVQAQLLDAPAEHARVLTQQLLGDRRHVQDPLARAIGPVPDTSARRRAERRLLPANALVVAVDPQRLTGRGIAPMVNAAAPTPRRSILTGN